MRRFGASGAGAAVFARFGFTAGNVAAKARAVVEYYKKVPVPDLGSRPAFEAGAEVDGH
jgi:hypothetical protein